MDFTTYQLIKVVHILSATVLFGTGLGTAFHFWLAHRSGRVEAIAIAARSTVIADFLFTTPAVIVQPVTGLVMAVANGYPLGSPWLAASIALYILAGACWIPVVFIQMRMRRIAEQCLREGTALPPRYHRLFRTWFWLGWPAFIALVVVFWLMVAKP
jgi:uncharacterized membrane protein